MTVNSVNVSKVAGSIHEWTAPKQQGGQYYDGEVTAATEQ